MGELQWKHARNFWTHGILSPTSMHLLSIGFESMTEVDVPQKSYKCQKLIKPRYTTIRTSSTEALLDKQDIVSKEHAHSNGYAISAVDFGEVNPQERYLEELDNRELTNRRLLHDFAVWLRHISRRRPVGN